MKSIPRILAKVYSEPWLILPDKHRAIRTALEAHLSGEPSAFIESDSDNKKPPAPYQKVGQYGTTALISVSGIIGKRLSWLESMCGGYDVDALTNALSVADADPSIRNKLIDFDTPGGTVTGVPEAADAILASDKIKPVYSFTEMSAYSAGIWLATQARQLWTTKSAGVGSIGVYMAFLDESAALEAEGLKVNAIAAGRYKLSGASFKPMDDDERAMFQAQVDRVHEQFKAAVKNRRPKMPDEMMEGQTFDGEEAVSIGLVSGVVSGLPEVLRMLS